MKSLTQKTKIWHNNHLSRRFGKYSFPRHLILALSQKFLTKWLFNTDLSIEKHLLQTSQNEETRVIFITENLFNWNKLKERSEFIALQSIKLNEKIGKKTAAYVWIYDNRQICMPTLNINKELKCRWKNCKTANRCPTLIWNLHQMEYISKAGNYLPALLIQSNFGQLNY